MKWSSTLLMMGVCLFLATPAFAQTRVSLTGGLNRASLNADPDAALAPNLQSLKRMSVGLAATVPVSDRFGIQLGGTYAQKGGGLDLMGILDSAGMPAGMEGDVIPENLALTSNMEMDYLEFTVLGRIGFPLSGERASGHLLAGPFLAWRTSCQFASSVRGDVSVDVNQSCDEIDLDSKNYDWGIAGGAGIEIGLTERLDASVGLLYTLGLLDITNGASETLKNRALTLRAGLSFPIG